MPATTTLDLPKIVRAQDEGFEIRITTRQGPSLVDDGVVARPDSYSVMQRTAFIRYSPVAGAVMVYSLTAPTLMRSRSSNLVGIGLQNLTGRAVIVQAFWLLGHEGDREPWMDAVFESAPKEVVVQPYGGEFVYFSDVVPAIDGTYALSAWAHVREGDSFMHSDDLWLRAPVSLSAA